jgi:hypothetical protein
MGRTYYSSTDSIYVKFLRSNLKISRHLHAYNCSCASNIRRKFLGVFILCLSTKFHMHSFNGSLLIVIIKKTKFRVQTDAMLL